MKQGTKDKIEFRVWRAARWRANQRSLLSAVKARLCLVDSLYASGDAISKLLRFRSFVANCAANVMASQVSFAIDSIMVDILRNKPFMSVNRSG